MKKWFSSSSDLRKSGQVSREILGFIEENAAKTVSMIEQIIGCPHEEGIDYPDGDYCPTCSYWRGRDRFSGEMLQQKYNKVFKRYHKPHNPTLSTRKFAKGEALSKEVIAVAQRICKLLRSSVLVILSHFFVTNHDFV